MNQRRLFMVVLGACILGHSALLRAQTQASSTGLRRVGVLAPSTQAKEEIVLKPFFDQMRQLGWVEGHNIAYDRVYADDRQGMLPGLAAELVARNPEAIYAPPNTAAVAAKEATQTIPIVFGAVADPAGIGLVVSLARPGGNVTGISGSVGMIGPKRVELLREILPRVRLIGWVGDPNDPAATIEQQTLASAATSAGLTIVFAEAARPFDIDAAVAKLADSRVEAIYQGVGPLIYNVRARLIELANQRRLPIIANASAVADAGALFSYGASLADQLRRSALLLDKVLKGAKPAELPVEQPTLFELVVNLKAAKALGITIPQSVVLRSDRVIE